MAARLCIHIGMPKTGTSLIQAVLAGMREPLEQQGAWVPPSLLGSHRLAVAATPEDSPLRKRADFVDIQAAMPLAQALEQPAAAAAKFDAVILSSEYFSECSPRLLKSLLESAGIRAADVTIIAALRRQDRILVSGFNQDVKALNRTVPLKWPLPRAERLDWHARLAPWADAFGKAAIKVQVFDRAVAAGKSLTFEVLDACGVAYDAAIIEQHEERHDRSENRSLPAELLAFKFFANAVTKQGQLDWLIEEALAHKVGGGPYQLDPATARAIIEHYRESNRRVADEYLGESGDLFDDRVEEGGKTTLAVSPATIAVLLSICAAELNRLRAEARDGAEKAKTG